jgi:hypothetical protein
VQASTLREEHRLRVFEIRALGRIFGSKRDDLTGRWRKLHKEELYNLYFSPEWQNQGRRDGRVIKSSFYFLRLVMLLTAVYKHGHHFVAVCTVVHFTDVLCGVI